MSGSDVMFNIARGEVGEKIDDGGGTWRILFLEATEADDTLRDYDTISALLGAAGNTESAVATRQALANVTTAVDDTANTRVADADDVTFTPASGNPVVKNIVYFDPDGTDTDTQNVPVTAHALDWTPDGTQKTLQIANFWQSS